MLHDFSSMQSNWRQRQLQFFSPRMFNDRCDLRRAAVANLLIFIFQCCNTTKHADSTYPGIGEEESLSDHFGKMCAVAFKPVIGIVRQWQPDCYHTPFVATQHLCNLLPQITFTIYLPLPLFFIALDYRIYLSDRKLFKIVRLPKQKQPRNFLTESENGISRKSFLNFRIKFPTLSCKLKKKKERKNQSSDWNRNSTIRG